MWYLSWQGPWFYAGALVGVLTKLRDEGGLDFLMAGTIDPFAIDALGLHWGDLTLSTPVLTTITDVSYDPDAYPFQVRAYLSNYKIMGAFFPGFVAGDFPAPPVSLPIPIEGATLALVGYHPDGAEAVVARAEADPGGVTYLELPPTLLLDTVAPSPGQQVVTSMPTLEWTPLPGATAYWVELSGGGVYARWLLPPTSTQLVVSDLGQGSFQLPPSTTIRWSVTAYTDSGYTAEELTDPFGSGAPPPLWTQSITHFANGTFVTAP